MADVDDGLDEAFKGFGEDPVIDPVVEPVIPPVESPKDEPKPAEEPKEDDKSATEKTTEAAAQDAAADGTKEKAEVKAPTTDEGTDKSKEEMAKPPETPETPPAADVPQPLTKDDVKSVVSDLLNTERSSSKELETTTQEVLEAYYPDGISNILVDEKTGKKLMTPADVVEASDGQMTTDEAAQWLSNEQYKLDKSVAEIKDKAKEIAETTVNFRRDAVTVLQRYDPLFKAYPQVQQKVWDTYIGLVTADKDKGVILKAPDMLKFYDDFLDPYRMAMELGQQKPATDPTPPATPEPPKPSADDRLDEGGDGGSSSVVDDPNDFAQQLKKELERDI